MLLAGAPVAANRAARLPVRPHRLSAVPAAQVVAADRDGPADLEADVRAAAPPGTVAGLDITADATGLTLFATVRRADEPG